jgi:hypothetical protein
VALNGAPKTTDRLTMSHFRFRIRFRVSDENGISHAEPRATFSLPTGIGDVELVAHGRQPPPISKSRNLVLRGLGACWSSR